MTPELYLAGYPPEDLVLEPAFQEACRAACEALARETADGGPAVLAACRGSRRQSAQRHRAARRRADRGGAVQGRLAELRRVRREARVRPWPSPGPIVFRGVRIGVPICEDIWAGPVECVLDRGESCSCPTPSPTSAQARHPAERRGERSSRAACRSSISTRSADRTRWCSRAPCRAERRPQPRRPASGLPAVVARTVWKRGSQGWVCVEGPQRSSRRATRRITPPASWACATMSRRTGFPAWCSASRRRRFGALRRHGRRRARRGARPRRHAAYRFTSNESLSDAAGCARALDSLRHRPDRRAGRGVEHALSKSSRQAARHHQGEHPE